MCGIRNWLEALAPLTPYHHVVGFFAKLYRKYVRTSHAEEDLYRSDMASSFDYAWWQQYSAGKSNEGRVMKEVQPLHAVH